MRNFYLFWGSKWPKSGPLRPISSTHLKVLAMSMWSNTDVKPLQTLFRKWPKSGILTFIGPKTPQIGPLWPISHAPLKVLAMCMWSYTIYIYICNINGNGFGPCHPAVTRGDKCLSCLSRRICKVGPGLLIRVPPEPESRPEHQTSKSIKV